MFLKYLVKVEDNRRWRSKFDRKDESNRTCGDLKASYPIENGGAYLEQINKKYKLIEWFFLNGASGKKRNIEWRLSKLKGDDLKQERIRYKPCRLSGFSVR